MWQNSRGEISVSLTRNFYQSSTRDKLLIWSDYNYNNSEWGALLSWDLGPQDKGESANVSLMTRNWHWHWTVTVDWHPRISHWLVSIILVETLSFSQLNALVWGHTLQTAIIPVIIHHIGSYWYLCCYIRLHIHGVLQMLQLATPGITMVCNL